MQNWNYWKLLLKISLKKQMFWFLEVQSTSIKINFCSEIVEGSNSSDLQKYEKNNDFLRFEKNITQEVTGHRRSAKEYWKKGNHTSWESSEVVSATATHAADTLYLQGSFKRHRACAPTKWQRPFTVLSRDVQCPVARVRI